jgi:signal transduction histidine kinase
LGLGLTIANELVLAHGGRLELDPQPGQGSRFTIRLPLSPF